MGYDKNGAEIIGEEILKPCNCIDIKTVGRLVKKDNIGVAEKSLCKKHLNLFAFLKLRHLHIEIRVGKTETLNELRGIRLCLPAVELSKLALELGCADTVLIGEIRLCVELVLLFHYIIEALIAHYNGIKNRELLECKVVLLKDGHSYGFGNINVTLCRLKLAAKNTKEG